MSVFQYMRIHRKYIPLEVQIEYNLTPAHFDSKGYAYVEIRKGMYGLKEASILAYDQLKGHLAPFGYSPMRCTPGYWKHATKPTTFTLAVDDFGIKSFCRQDTDHLLNALRQKYAITVDLTGSSYLGLTLEWNYAEGYVDISMPGYVSKALLKFKHNKPTHLQHAPHKWNKPVYGQKMQFAPSDSSPLLDNKGTLRVQSISGTFLYYARAVDPTIFPALNEISNAKLLQLNSLKQLVINYLITYTIILMPPSATMPVT